jgi:hypothetical protein
VYLPAFVALSKFVIDNVAPLLILVAPLNHTIESKLLAAIVTVALVPVNTYVLAAGCVVMVAFGFTAPNTTFEVAFVHPLALYATAL